jgi:hypothetical protein
MGFIRVQPIQPIPPMRGNGGGLGFAFGDLRMMSLLAAPRLPQDPFLAVFADFYQLLNHLDRVFLIHDGTPVACDATRTMGSLEWGKDQTRNNSTGHRRNRLSYSDTMSRPRLSNYLGRRLRAA